MHTSLLTCMHTTHTDAVQAQENVLMKLQVLNYERDFCRRK